MSKIKPVDNEEDSSIWDGINLFNNQNKLWFSVDFLGRIGVLDKKEIVKLKKDDIDHLLVGVPKQEYKKDEKN